MAAYPSPPPPIIKSIDTSSLRSAPYFTRSVVVCTLFGALSLGYLAMTLADPDWLSDLTPATATTDPSTNQGQRANARLAADIDQMREQMNQMQLELARVKTEVAQSATAAQTVSNEVAVLRERVAASQTPAVPVAVIETPAAIVAQPTSAAAAAPSAPTKTSENVVPATTVKSKTSGSTPAAPNILNTSGVVTSKLETGSVSAVKAATDPISFGEAIVKPAPKPVGLQISSGATVDSLRLSWSLLSERHSDVLKSMEPRFTTQKIGGEDTFNLVAGPVKSKAEAQRVCKALTAKGVACQVGDFGGNAL